MASPSGWLSDWLGSRGLATVGMLLAESRVLGMLIGVAVATSVFQSAGGQTGEAWRPVDFEGFRLAELSAACVALAASLRGASPSSRR